jgi:mannose-6-phosphate isomerase
MRYVVIWATGRCRGLAPLAEDGTPAAFLPLGDRRSLLRRSVERLRGAPSAGRLVVFVREEDREQAASEVGDEARIVSCASGGEVNSLAAVASEAASSPGRGEIVLETASQLPLDESRYWTHLMTALSRLEAGEPAVRLVGEAGTEGRPPEAIVCRAEHLVERLAAIRVVDPSPERLLAVLGQELPEERVRGGQWIRISDWRSAFRALEYVEKPWGHERLWALNRHYAGKVLFIKKGESLSLQYHEAKDETIRVASGRLEFSFGGLEGPLETCVLEPGMSFAIPPRLVHRMEALDDCSVIEVSTPHLLDVVRLEDRYGRG